MAAKRTSVAAVDEQVKRRFQEIGLLVIATAALYFLLSLITFSLDDAGWTHSGSGQPFHNAGGETGAWLADFFFSFFGLMAYLFPLMIIYHAVVVYREREKEGLWLLLLLRWGGFIITVIAGASIADLHFLRIGASLPGSSGGLLGETVGLFLFHQLGATGATLILLTLMLIGITLLTNLSWLGLCETIGRHMLNGIGAVTRRLGQGLARRHEKTKTDRARTQELNKSERPAVAQRRVEPLIGTATRQGGSIDDTARQTKQSASTAEPEAEKKAEKRTLKIRRNEPIDPVTEPGDEQRKGWSDYNLLELEQMFQSERAAEPSDQAPGTNPFLKHDDPSAQPHHSTQSEATPETNAVESDHQPAQPQHQTPSEEPPLTNANPTDDRSTRPRPGNRPDEPLLSPEMATKINPHVPRDLFAESSPPEPDAVEMPAKKSALPSHDDKPALHTEWLAEAETVPVRSARAIDRGEPEILASREAITKPNDQVSPAQPVDPAQPNAPGPSSPTEIPVKQSKQPAADRPPQRLYQNRGQLPPLSLLDETTEQSVGYSRQVLEEMSRQVEVILSDFGVEVEVVAVEPGPVITRFEVQPAAGVKVSRITNLAKDLARALSVTSVRVVEIIPGKSVIGLEIPNRHRDTVHLREVLSSKVYHDSLSPITLVLGKDIGGNPVVADLAKMPHLLVAGTTGSGKSVAVNTMILSMLYKATPKQVRLIMIDPKMLELSVYEEIPHLLTPVVTDMKEAANALRWSVAEMDRRYRLMSRLGVRNLASFNQKVNLAIQHGEPIADPTFDASTAPPGMNTIPTLEPLPSIVIVIDELADMMMIVGKKVEELIARLAQKARAAGLHLILATQRPSVDVLTGLIKANIPTRLAFQVATKIDSRTILDQSGAETLLGNGDMLFLPPGTAIPDRAHGAFVSDDEVNSVVEFLKRTGPRDYISDITKDPDDNSSDSGGILSGSANSDADPLYDQAVKIVTESRKASISNVQRRLKIGYNRAARMLDEMEESGIIGALEPNGAREVLAPPPPSIDG